jgi:hypothetical protein
MSESKPASEVIFLTTSTSPTTVPEWNKFRVELYGAAPIPTDRPGERNNTLFLTSNQPSAGTSLVFFGGTNTLPIDLPAPNAVQPGTSVTPAPADRAYPHLLEAAQPAVSLVRRCLEDAHLALESFEESDFAGVATRLSAIAAQCATAHPLTTFNEGFGAVVSFVRRAAISADVAAISRRPLNAMIRALNSVSNDPMMSVGEAADILSALSDSGWTGEYAAVERLMASLLAENVESEDSHLSNESQQA